MTRVFAMPSNGQCLMAAEVRGLNAACHSELSSDQLDSLK